MGQDTEACLRTLEVLSDGRTSSCFVNVYVKCLGAYICMHAAFTFSPNAALWDRLGSASLRVPSMHHKGRASDPDPHEPVDLGRVVIRLVLK